MTAGDAVMTLVVQSARGTALVPQVPVITVVMATKNAKVSLGIKLVRTRLQFRVKRTISTKLFRQRAGVNLSGGKVTIKGSGKCRATVAKVMMAKRPGSCYVTVCQAAKGDFKAVYYRFTVSVVKKLPKKAVTKKK